jgi:hypothetical protein
MDAPIRTGSDEPDVPDEPLALLHPASMLASATAMAAYAAKPLRFMEREPPGCLAVLPSPHCPQYGHQNPHRGI